MSYVDEPVLSRRDNSYSDELYHHGIKGQKWGVRRFQNEDGTWTEAGKKRYSNRLSGSDNPSNKGFLRRWATGDHPLGMKRQGDRDEETYRKKIETLKSKGKDTKQYEKLYKAQRQANVDRDVYLSKMSTGKLLAQRLLLGPVGAHAYRSMDNAGINKGAAFAATFVSQFVPFGYIGAAAANTVANQKKYGAAAWSAIS